MSKTLSPKESRERIEVLRSVPVASLGVAPHGWDYRSPALIARAQHILVDEGISGVVYEAAPMVFWYRAPDGDIHCHDWSDQEEQ